MTEVEVYEGEVLPALISDQHALVRAESPVEFVEKARELADALVQVVEDRQLYATISGRKHPKVEAWTFLGSMMGAFGSAVFAVTEWTRPIERDGRTVGWEARVQAVTADGRVVGAAEAMCTRDEEHWGFNPVNKYGRATKARDDFALRSMAQTRATSKALRQPLGFLMQLAGYDPTPTEELGTDQAARPAQPKKATKKQVDDMKVTLKAACEIDAQLWSDESVLANAKRAFGRNIEKLEDMTADEVRQVKDGAGGWIVSHLPAVGEDDSIAFGE